MRPNKIQFSIEKKHDCQIFFLKNNIMDALTNVIKPNLMGQAFNRSFWVVDKVIQQLYPTLFNDLEMPILSLRGGENAKTLANVEQIVEFLQKNQCQRYDSLMVIGGAVWGMLLALLPIFTSAVFPGFSCQRPFCRRLIAVLVARLLSIQPTVKTN
ncbi:hypothetical protein [Candidatus Paracaedibacter symbiosus]|uniref:hypothetical protein n=1 Tax=Candidatus Paracaedibacter symbiosus TaxID=244582 RepID=UPI000509D39E|nr:hypothetical protein [Candidatus Paracaedibacter symbiosus]